MDRSIRDQRYWQQIILASYANAKVILQKEKKAIEEQVAATRYVNLWLYYVSPC